MAVAELVLAGLLARSAQPPAHAAEVATVQQTVPPGQKKIPSNPQNPESPSNPHRPVWKLFTDTARDFEHLPSWDTAEWLGVGGAGALAIHPFDDDINAHLISKGWTDAAFAPGKWIGYGWTQFGAAAGTMIWGRYKEEPKVVHLGTDLLRAQITTQLVTVAIKESVRRERPDHSGGYSFPSGHASVTFASATVLQRHLGWKAWPAYLVASYVAASRLHENRHFASDVIFGAAVGTVCGRTTTRHGRSNWAMMPMGGPGTIGMVIAYTPHDSRRDASR